MAVLLGLLVAVSYGAGDFVGGLASRRVTPAVVVLVSQAVGLCAIALVLLLPNQEPVGADLLRGVGAGGVGMVGVVLLYRGLSVGAMSIVAPITAVGSALVPVLWGLLHGERPSALALAGVVLAVVAVALVATPEDEGPLPPHLRRELTLALTAGASFGVVFIFLGGISDASGLWAVATARVTSVSLMAVFVAVRRVRLDVRGGTWWLVAGAGILDVTANGLFVSAARRGLLSLVAPVSALYPVGTIVLAAILLRERVSRRQRIGLGLALVAVVSIAA